MNSEATRVLPRIEGAHPAAVIAGKPRPGPEHWLPDPATGQWHVRVGWASTDDVEDAVEAAHRVLSGWAQTPPRQRAHVLRDIAAGIRTHAAEFTDLIVQETGKRKAEARAETHFSAEYFDWFADAATIPLGSHILKDDKRFVVGHRSVGVVAAVTPWNFPMSIPARKIAAALAAGCPVVLKPSELTPLSALALVALIEKHAPTGVANVVVGDGEELTGALVDNDKVAAVTFTGSTRVGVLIAQRAMRTMTRVTMELGGMAPFIIDADASLDVALDALMVAKFRNNGASCIAANNVFVHQDLQDRVVEELARRISSLQVGAPSNDATDVGPMLRPEHVARLDALVVEAGQKGCESWAGSIPEQGWFCAPTLVSASNDTTLWREEIFGPVCAIRPFEDMDELVEEVNTQRMGLAGYVISSDIERAMATASRLNVGIVGINNGAPNAPEVPFGGVGLAGLGREGGLEGMLEFLESQTISIVR